MLSKNCTKVKVALWRLRMAVLGYTSKTLAGGLGFCKVLGFEAF